MSKYYFINFPKINYFLPITENQSLKIGSETISKEVIYGIDGVLDTKNNASVIKPTIIIDITKLFGIKDYLKDNAYIFYPYVIRENERPEDIANFYYGDPFYFWLVLISNNIINPYHEWPLEESAFNAYIDKKYEITYYDEESESMKYISGSEAINLEDYYPKIYYDGYGNIVDKITYDNLDGIPSVGKYSETPLEVEIRNNNNKRDIQLIGKQYLPQIIKEVNTILKE